MNPKKLKYLNKLVKTLVQIKNDYGKEYYYNILNDIKELMNTNDTPTDVNETEKIEDFINDLNQIKSNNTSSGDINDEQENVAIVNELVDEFQVLMKEISELSTFIYQVLNEEQIASFNEKLLAAIKDKYNFDFDFMLSNNTESAEKETNSKYYGINPITLHYDVCKCLPCQEIKQYDSQIKIYDYISNAKGIKLIQIR